MSNKKIIIPVVVGVVVVLFFAFGGLNYSRKAIKMIFSGKGSEEQVKIPKPKKPKVPTEEGTSTVETPQPGQPGESGQPSVRPPAALPNFLPVMRGYRGMGFDAAQLNATQEVGFEYIQDMTNFDWIIVEPSDDSWNFRSTDNYMNLAAERGLKVIPFYSWPKADSPPWDQTATRTSAKGREEFNEYAFEATNRYKNHPAWAGIVAVWGGSSDVWDREYPTTDPEVMVSLLNAAYDGIKRADPNTIVIGFNFATTYGAPKEEWEEFHRRAFALNPKFDWYGAQTHDRFVTTTTDMKYAGIQGLVQVRDFLDRNGYRGKPMWVNEGGFTYGEDGLPAQLHAEQVVETFLIAPTLPINLKGWVYFALFGKSMGSGDDEALYGIMNTVRESNPPTPRLAYNALKVLYSTIRFADYGFEQKKSGELNASAPAHVYQFKKTETPNSKLWVVFSPSLVDKARKQLIPGTRQSVNINVGTPGAQVRVIEMYGQQRTMQANSSGNITVESTSAPLYITLN